MKPIDLILEVQVTGESFSHIDKTAHENTDGSVDALAVFQHHTVKGIEKQGFRVNWAKASVVPMKPGNLKKAVLRTHVGELPVLDEIVEISEDWSRGDGIHGDKIPFSVGSNQVILELDELSQDELLMAIENTELP
jgi:hypothetical protein